MNVFVTPTLVNESDVTPAATTPGADAGGLVGAALGEDAGEGDGLGTDDANASVADAEAISRFDAFLASAVIAPAAALRPL
ncbi:MAG: hypothetical protein NVSMB5_20900 [Candidatus Velthaea sp.]